jgi:hypothetical protein
MYVGWVSANRTGTIFRFGETNEERAPHDWEAPGTQP